MWSGSGNRVSMLKETLENLCCSREWCYGISWGFDERNSLFLTLRDAYYDEDIRGLIDTMMQQVHVLGEGVIGKAAFAKKHRWVHSDGHEGMQKALGSYEYRDIFQDDSEFNWQFSLGIKTVAVISVDPWGVVQLGSAQKIQEKMGFCDQVKELLRGLGEGHVLDLQESTPLSSDCPFYDSRNPINPKLACCVSPSPSLQRAAPSFDSSSLTEDQVHLWEEPFLLFPGDLYNCAATQESSMDYDCSVITSSWPPHLPDELLEKASSLDLRGYTTTSHAPGLISLSDFIDETSCTDISYNLPTNSNNVMIPVTNGDHAGFDVGTSNSLFSKLGLHQIFGTVTTSSISSSQVERRNNEDYSWGVCIPELDGKRELLHPGFRNGKRNITDHDENEVTEHETGASTSNKQDGPAANNGKKKKKEKAGTRPRPKDRQMIQDRLAELRELIPNGDKMSIDRLLERTIKHLSFMSSLTKHADSLKQLHKAKDHPVQEGVSSNGAVGVTWACEVGEQNMFCPLLVEDLTTTGQLLIEILCDAQDMFLEIVDAVRGLDMIILKGVIEVRENKIWAHFIVQAKGNHLSTRLQVFTSLLKLLESKSLTADTNIHRGNVVSSRDVLFNNCLSNYPFPVHLADPL